MAGVDWQQTVRSGGHNRRLDASLTAGGQLTVEGAVERFLYARERATTTRQNLLDNLLGGRFTSWRQAHAIDSLEALTGEVAVRYLVDYRQVRGAAVETVDKVRRQLLEFGGWCRDALGVDVLAKPPLTRFRVPALLPDSPGVPEDEGGDEPALVDAEAQALLNAARPGRDRLAVKMLLYTGLRGSELVGLCTPEVLLDARPPRLLVRRTSHHKSRVKTAAGYREIPLDMGGRGLAADVRRYLEAKPEKGGRPTDSPLTELFLSRRVLPGRARGAWSMNGLQMMLDRLGERTGIRAHPHRFRHTCATNLVNAGMHEQHLMTVMGWKDERMITRYFRGRTSQTVLEMAAKIRY